MCIWVHSSYRTLKWIFHKAIFHSELLTRENKKGIEPRLYKKQKRRHWRTSDGALRLLFWSLGACAAGPMTKSTCWCHRALGEAGIWLGGGGLGGGVVVWGRSLWEAWMQGLFSVMWIDRSDSGCFEEDHQQVCFCEPRPLLVIHFLSRWKMANGAPVPLKV